METDNQIPEGVEAQRASLGTNTKLGHTSKTDLRLDKLGKVLKANTEAGLRDNYTLVDVSHAIVRKYEGNKEQYKKYMRTTDSVDDTADVTKAKVHSFSRIPICGNILETYSVVKQTVEHGSYVQTHIARCGNVWLCPVCGSLIQSRRADEVQTAIDWAEAEGYTVVMITYTASHKAHYALRDFGKRLQDAYRGTMKQVLRLRKKYEVGNIKAVEFTFSEENRWHKHFHVLYILKAECDVVSFYQKVNAAWELQCINTGLLDSADEKAVADFREHATSLSCGAEEVRATYINKLSDSWFDEARKKAAEDVQEGKIDVFEATKNIQEYIASKGKDFIKEKCAKATEQKKNNKNVWTIADEMTKSVIKIGRNRKHMTPFQVLYEIATTDDKTYRYTLIDAFIEYAIHTKGLHQQDWSNGLKALVGITDKTDEALCDEQNDTAVYVAALTAAHWHLLRSKNLRIQYSKTLKSAESVEDAYSKLVDFFDKVAGKDCPDVLTAEQARLLDAFEDNDGCDFTEEEKAEYNTLQVILDAVYESMPTKSYSAVSHCKDDFVRMSESEKLYERNRQKWDLLDMHITNLDIKAIKHLTPIEIKAYKSKFKSKFNSQMTLFSAPL